MREDVVARNLNMMVDFKEARPDLFSSGVCDRLAEPSLFLGTVVPTDGGWSLRCLVFLGTMGVCTIGQRLPPQAPAHACVK